MATQKPTRSESDRITKWQKFKEALWQNTFNIASLIVAVCALFLTVSELRSSRIHNRLSVQPHLQISHTMRPDVGAIRLENAGVGPGHLRTFELFLDGKPVTSWNDFVNQIGLQGKGQFQFSVFKSQTWIQNGTAQVLFEVNTAEQATILNKNINRVNVSVCYCSVYNDCWVASLHKPWNTEGQCGVEKPFSYRLPKFSASMGSRLNGLLPK